MRAELGLGVIDAFPVQMGQCLQDNGLWLVVRFSMLDRACVCVCERAILRTASVVLLLLLLLACLWYLCGAKREGLSRSKCCSLSVIGREG